MDWDYLHLTALMKESYFRSCCRMFHFQLLKTFLLGSESKVSMVKVMPPKEFLATMFPDPADTAQRCFLMRSRLGNLFFVVFTFCLSFRHVKLGIVVTNVFKGEKYSIGYLISSYSFHLWIVSSLEYFPQQKFSLLCQKIEILQQLFELTTISKFTIWLP